MYQNSIFVEWFSAVFIHEQTWIYSNLMLRKNSDSQTFFKEHLFFTRKFLNWLSVKNLRDGNSRLHYNLIKKPINIHILLPRNSHTCNELIRPMKSASRVAKKKLSYGHDNFLLAYIPRVLMNRQLISADKVIYRMAATIEYGVI